VARCWYVIRLMTRPVGCLCTLTASAVSLCSLCYRPTSQHVSLSRAVTPCDVGEGNDWWHYFYLHSSSRWAIDWLIDSNVVFGFSINHDDPSTFMTIMLSTETEMNTTGNGRSSQTSFFILFSSSLARRPVILAEAFRGFPQSLQVNVGIVP
jgi:hypothetical protein